MTIAQQLSGILIIQWWKWVRYILFCSITPTNLGQFSKQGSVLKSAGSDNFKTTHPFICNLTKFWLRYLRLKTQDIILFFSWNFFFWNLIDMKITQIWTIWSKNCPVHHKRHQFQQELFLEMEGLGCFIYCFSHKMFRSQ